MVHWFFVTAEQYSLSGIATNIDAFVQRLRQFCEPWHPCDMGADDCSWLELSLFPCNAQLDRAAIGRAGNFVGVHGRLFAFLSEEILSTLAER